MVWTKWQVGMKVGSSGGGWVGYGGDPGKCV